MPPVHRRARVILNVLTVLSLLLCVAVAALHTRSFWVEDWVTFTDAGGRHWRFRSQGSWFSAKRFDGWPARESLRWTRLSHAADAAKEDPVLATLPHLGDRRPTSWSRWFV